MNAPRSAHGFTLMEVMVASAALSVLLIAVYSLFALSQRLRNEAETRTRNAGLEARAIDLLRRDLRDALVLAGPITTSLKAEAQGTGEYDGYLALTTTTGRTQDETVGSDVQEVEYYIEPSDTESSGGRLVRTVQRILLSDAPESPVVQPLLHQVDSLSVAIYDGDQWLDQWDSTVTTNQLPQAIRVRVERVADDESDEDSPPPLEVLVPWITVPVTNAVAEEEGQA